MSVTLIILWLASAPVTLTVDMSSLTRCQTVAAEVMEWADKHDTRILAVCTPK
jgi:hypothetical protein